MLCCGEESRETIRHIDILLKCSRWEKQRQEHMRGIITAATNISRSILGGSKWYEETVIVVLMLGGEIDGRSVSSWVPSQIRTVIVGSSKWLDSYKASRYLGENQFPVKIPSQRAVLAEQMPLRVRRHRPRC